MNWKTIFRSLKNRDMQKRVLVVLAIIIVYRLLAHIPIPLAEPTQLREVINNLVTGSDFGGFLNLLSGGALASFSIVLVGLTPFITASIITQLLTKAIPRLEELHKDGESGRRKINQWTRMLTIPLAIVQSIAFIFILKSTVLAGNAVAVDLTAIDWFVGVTAMTAGSVLLMWLGELITEQGIGNGISILIFAGIISQLPSMVSTISSALFDTSNGVISVFNWFVIPMNPLVFWVTVAILVASLALLYFLVKINEAQRVITINYAKRVQGNSSYGGVKSILPVKLIAAGVIPVIFAQSILQIPIIISQLTGYKGTGPWAYILRGLNSSYWCKPSELVYSIGLIVYIVMVIFFAYFYTSITFNPLEIADNMKKQGGFIPGIRPGKPTSDYLNKILNYLIFIGACGLTIVCVLPYVFNGVFGASVSFGGTSLIIIVSVLLETLKQIESQMMVRNYKGFLND